MKKYMWLGIAGLLTFTGVANAYTLDKTEDWTLTDSASGATSVNVETWDSNVYDDQVLDTANISVNISTLVFTSDTLLGKTTSSKPFVKVTLAVVDGAENLETYTITSAFMQGGVATVDGNGKYVYEFGATSFGTIPVYENEVDFLQTAGTGYRSYSVSFDLYDSGRLIVNSGYTLTGTGSVGVSYVYSGTPVPEPATGGLALAGIGMLFAKRRRSVA